MELFKEADAGNNKEPEKSKNRKKPNVSIKLPEEYIKMWEEVLKEQERQGIVITKTDYLKNKIFETHYKIIVMGQQDLF
ncbi:MAG: hypothetical protein HPY53_12415 [Brevinematales bacterium]|nr:hypothetical protein [Brevinematales bacterium]